MHTINWSHNEKDYLFVQFEKYIASYDLIQFKKIEEV